MQELYQLRHLPNSLFCALKEAISVRDVSDNRQSPQNVAFQENYKIMWHLRICISLLCGKIVWQPSAKTYRQYMANPVHLYQSMWAASVVISVTDSCDAGERMPDYLHYVTLVFASNRTTMHPFPQRLLNYYDSHVHSV